jgi:hypothetical protein
MTTADSPELPASLRPRPARSLAHILAGALLLVAILGLLGQAQGLERLAAPFDAWPRLRILSCTALAGLAIGFYGFLRRSRAVSLGASAFTALLGLTSLAGTAGMFRLPDEGMALASAVMVTTAAMGIFLAALLGDRQEELCLGIAGFVLLALAITFAVARIAGVVDPLTETVVAGASIQIVAGSFLLGLSFLRLVWSRGLAESAGWLAIAIGFATLITVMVLWRALSAKEREQVLSQTHQAAVAKRAALVRDLGVATRSLGRAAEWKLAGASLDQQVRDLRALQRDLPGLEGGLWLAVSPSPEVPAGRTVADPSLDSVWQSHLRKTGGLRDSIAYLPLDPAARRFMIVAPGCTVESCSGAMAGVVRSAGFFASVFSDTASGFRFAIESGRRPFDGSPRPSAAEETWTQSLPIEMGQLRMSLTAWPMPSTLGRLQSNLPGLVLVMGMLVSGLLPLTIRLGQTARRSAREAERVRLAAALERSTDGIWEWDLVTDTTQRSAGLWRYLGYDPQAVSWERSSWTGLIHPDDRARVEAALQRHVAGETASFDAEYRIRSRTGEWHAILDRGRVVERSPAGHALRMLGISADVTETRSAEAAREATERRFRAIFDSGFQFQLLLDRNGQVIEANQVALADRGTSLEAVRHKPVWETLWWALDPNAAARIREATAAAMAGATPHYEEQLRDPEGVLTILEIAVKPILDATGEPTQFLLEARDITARRRAEAALQEVETLTTMGRVAARVAHEINNPLAGIQNSFLLIKGAVPATHPHFGYVGAIEREIARIAAVTRQLYETYRPEQDTSGETALRTVLGDAIAFLEQVNRSAGVKVVTEYLNIPSIIPLPSAMLRQIAYNLIQNAIEVCPSGSTVHVQACADDGKLEIMVRDCGPGVPAELRERIFDPFFSTKDPRMKTGGMGLGLALVRRTVTAAGGTITVRDAEGAGSEFVVTLPLKTPDRGV